VFLARQHKSLLRRTVVARIYSNQSVEYLAPPDCLHPPTPGELRVMLDCREMHHLEIFNGQQWIDLGEVTSELLEKHNLDPQMGF
jgi:hypothetical protein